MSLIITIIKFLVSTYIIYKCCENFESKITYFIYVGITVLSNVITNGFSNFIGTIIVALISGLITVFIYYKIYERSNSFLGFLGLSILVSIAIALVIALIGIVISGLAIGGSGILSGM